MSRTDDLKNLLERLKGEVGRAADPELPPEPPARNGYAAGRAPAEPAPAPPAAPPAAGAPAARDSYPPRHGGPPRPEFARQDHGPSGANMVWSENKETMLFGMLASLIVLLCGVAASFVFLTVLGAAAFALFAGITGAALYGYSRAFRAGAPAADAAALSARLDQLSRKVDALSVRGAPPAAAGGPRGGDRELEQKVEELRMLVKSLAKAVEDK